MEKTLLTRTVIAMGLNLDALEYGSETDIEDTAYGIGGTLTVFKAAINNGETTPDTVATIEMIKQDAIEMIAVAKELEADTYPEHPSYGHLVTIRNEANNIIRLCGIITQS